MNCIKEKQIKFEGNAFNIIRKTKKMKFDYFFDACVGIDEYYDDSKREFKKAKIIIVNSTSSGVRGVCILSPYYKSGLYITLLCSKRKSLGSKLIKIAEKIAKKCKFKKIVLHSVPSAEKFYEKHGYVKDENSVYSNKFIKLVPTV